MSCISAGLARAVALAAVISFVAVAGAEAQDNAPTVTSVRQTITNSSPYELRLGMTVVAETGTVTDQPAAKIAPGGKDTARVTTPSPVNGVDILTAYNAYRVQPGPDKYTGTILIRTGSDCTTLFILRPVCLTYAGDNRAFADGGGALRATWGNNGDTTSFLGVFTVTGAGGGPAPARRTPYEDIDVLSRAVTDTELAQASAEDAGDGDNGAPWDTLPSVINNTDYRMRLVTIWVNEQADFHSLPPGTIDKGGTGFSHVGNDTKYHGVATVYMWDLYDPATNEWRGTTFTYAAIKCGFSVIKIGCTSYEPAATGVADPEGRTTLRVEPNAGEAPRYTRPQYFFGQTKKDTSADGDPKTDER